MNGIRPRVLFVVNSLPAAGAERHLVELACRGQQSGAFSPRVVCLKAPGTLAATLVACGVPFESNWLRHRYDARALALLADTVRRFQPDVIYTHHGINEMLLAEFARVVFGVARVCVVHSTRDVAAGQRFSRAQRALLRRADAVVGVAPSHCAYLVNVEGLADSRTISIANGVDTARFAPRSAHEMRASRGRRALVVVGSLRREKGQQVLLDALPRIVHEYPNTDALLIGAGPAESELRARVETLGLQDHVHFVGQRHDVERLLPNLDVFVLPALPQRETFSMAALEAMASGVPVVASRVGSMGDMIADGHDGFLVTPGDPDQLADRVLSLFGAPDLAAGMGRNGRERVAREFTLERMVAEYGALFARLAGARAAPRPRVLLFGPAAEAHGGVATHVQTLLRSPVVEKFDVRHVASSGPRHADCHSEPTTLRGRALWSAVAQRPSLVHLNPSFDARSIARDTALACVARLTGAKVLIQFHGSNPAGLHRTTPWAVPLLGLLLRVADRVLVLNTQQASELQRRFRVGTKLRLIANMVPVASFTARVADRPAMSTPPTAVFLSRIGRDKGAEDVLHAAALLRDAQVPLTVELAGDGQVAALQQLAADLALNGSVRFLGYVQDRQKKDVLARADLFLLPSQLPEGLPYALLEAMAAGLPIVASDQGGIPDVVVHGENGYLVPPGSPVELAAAIRALVTHPETARRMGRVNRLKAERCFDVPVVAQHYVAEYASLLVDGARPPASAAAASSTRSARSVEPAPRHGMTPSSTAPERGIEPSTARASASSTALGPRQELASTGTAAPSPTRSARSVEPASRQGTTASSTRSERSDAVAPSPATHATANANANANALHHLLAFLDGTDYVGWDPYDIGPSAPQALGLALRGAPSRFRNRLLSIPPHENIKSRILTLRARARLVASHSALVDAKRLAHDAEILWQRRLPGLRGAAFGENFGYATRHGRFRSASPSLVLSVLAGLALLDTSQALQEGHWIDRAERIGDFLVHDLGVIDGPADSVSFPYGLHASLHLPNSTALAAAFLARLGALTHRHQWTALAERAGRHVVRLQQSDGFWFYSPRARYVDNFHSLFILASLRELMTTVPHPDFTRAFQNGLAYYRSTLLEPGGEPRHVVFPAGVTLSPLLVVRTDIRDCAMSISFFSALGDRFTASEIFNWTCARLRLRSDLFAFQRFLWGTPDTVFIRPQAWMALALADLLGAAR